MDYEEEIRLKTNKLIKVGVFILTLTYSCSHLYNYFNIQHDNIVENILEDIIEYESGVQIDITPDSEDYGFHIFPRKEHKDADENLSLPHTPQ